MPTLVFEPMDEDDPEYAAISHALDLLAAADNGSLAAAEALLRLGDAGR